jgi:hypothetical protein
MAVPLSLIVLLLSSALSANQFPWSRKKTVEFQRFEPPGKHFALEYPKKDWNVVPGAGTVLFVFAHKEAEASVTLDYTPLKQALAREEISQLFADLELEDVKERQPQVQHFTTALRTEADGRRVVVIDYVRDGLKGPERVRLYSLPSGVHLYRVTCTAPVAYFARYEAVFERMALTFRSAAVEAPAP